MLTDRLLKCRQELTTQDSLEVLGQLGSLAVRHNLHVGARREREGEHETMWLSLVVMLLLRTQTNVAAVSCVCEASQSACM
jgi:hypothetical protein